MAVTIDGTTGITMPAGGLANTAGSAVGTSDTQTLTNKTIQGGALTLTTAQATTSGTSIDFTGIPSWVKRITVMLSAVSTNGGSPIQIQIGTSGGVEATGYNSTGGYSIDGTSSSVASSTSGFVIEGAHATYTTAAAVRNGAVVLTNVSGNTWIASGAFGRSGVGASTAGACGGAKTLSGTLDRVRIITMGGTDTFDAGSVNIMYEG